MKPSFDIDKYIENLRKSMPLNEAYWDAVLIVLNTQKRIIKNVD